MQTVNEIEWSSFSHQYRVSNLVSRRRVRTRLFVDTPMHCGCTMPKWLSYLHQNHVIRPWTPIMPRRRTVGNDQTTRPGHHYCYYYYYYYTIVTRRRPAGHVARERRLTASPRATCGAWQSYTGPGTHWLDRTGENICLKRSLRDGLLRDESNAANSWLE